MAEKQDPLEEALGLTPMLPVPVREESKVETNDDLAADFKLTRDHLRKVASAGAGSVEELADVASQTQHPLMYQALASLISSVAAASDKLMNVHVKHRAAKTPSKTEPTPQSITNNLVFTGSTEQLQALIKGRRDD